MCVSPSHAVTRPGLMSRSRAARVRVWILTSGLAVLGAFTLLLVNQVGWQQRDYLVSFAVMVVVFAVLEPVYAAVDFGRSSEVITLREVPLVLGLMAGHPVQTVLASVIGPAIYWLISKERERPERVAFNVAQYLLTGSLAALVITSITGDAGIATPRAWIAASLGAVVSSILSMFLVLLAIWTSEGRPDSRLSIATLAVALWAALMNSSLGVLTAIVLSEHPAALVLFLAPMAGCALAYRALARDRLNQADLSFLYEAAQAVSVPGSELVGGLEVVLRRLASMKGAEVAEIWMAEQESQEWRRLAGIGGTALANLHGLERDELAGVSRLQVKPGRRGDVLPVPLQQLVASHGLVEGEFQTLRHNELVMGFLLVGHRQPTRRLSTHSSPLEAVLAGQLGTRLASTMLGQAVDELARQRNELAIRASQDSLTGLANRMLFLSTLEELIRRARPVTLAFIDLDDFKSVNDTYGHPMGDRVLQHVAQCFRQSFRSGDVVARLGGDEFAILAIDTTTETARLAAVRAIDAVAQPIVADGHRVLTGVSVGIAGRIDGESAGRLLARADAALYAAKRQGKGCVVVSENTDPDVPLR